MIPDGFYQSPVGCTMLAYELANGLSLLSRLPLLPGLLGSFRKRFPAVDFLLLEGDSDEISNWLHSSVVDIAFTVMPDKEMQTLPLLQDEMMVILPDTHPLKDSQTLRFSEIAERCFIMPKDGCIRKMLQENHITPTVTFEVREVYTILTMVQEYIGFTIVGKNKYPYLSERRFF
ncbi:LysR family transcriptional regulator substrate-binding protein [Brevibacillus sp. MER 51]|uniref:LysR family transcriptional regulator substrate-binding protein n=1 Tax=Brevibacillus sp. MER 51 TaxID=2939560 RepID=UPI00333F86FD